MWTQLVVLRRNWSKARCWARRLAAGERGPASLSVDACVVSPVLLRMSCLDPLRHYAQLDPPDRQPRQSGERTEANGGPLSYGGPRHPVLAKGGFENRLHPFCVGLLYRLATKQWRLQVSAMVNGTMRSPSLVRIQPLKPLPTSFGSPTDGKGLRRLHLASFHPRWVSPSRSKISPNRARCRISRSA